MSEEDVFQDSSDDGEAAQPLVGDEAEPATCSNRIQQICRESVGNTVLTVSSGNDMDRLNLNRSNVDYLISHLRSNPQITCLYLICNLSKEDGAIDSMVNFFCSNEIPSHVINIHAIGDWNDYFEQRFGTDDGTLLHCLDLAFQDHPESQRINLSLEYYGFCQDPQARQSLQHLLEHSKSLKSLEIRDCAFGTHFSFLLHGLQAQKQTLKEFSLTNIVFMDDNFCSTSILSVLETLVGSPLRKLCLDVFSDSEELDQALATWLSSRDCQLTHLRLNPRPFQPENDVFEGLSNTLFRILKLGKNWSLECLDPESIGNQANFPKSQEIQSYLMRNTYHKPVMNCLDNNGGPYLGFWAVAWSRLASLPSQVGASTLFWSIRAKSNELAQPIPLSHKRTAVA